MSHLGLDIGSHTTKVVQLEREGESWRLVAAGVVATPQPGILVESDKAIVDTTQSVKKLLDDAHISERNVVFSVPETHTYTRLVSFPPLNEAEIASAVEWQIESYIPLPKKDAIYDHQVVTRTEQGTEVLVVAVARKLVDRYLKIIEQLGLTPEAVETELLALSRSIAPSQKRCVLIDFGASSTDIGIATNKQLLLTRSFPTAGEALTRAVAQGIGVHATQAEEYKRTYGLLIDQLEGKVKQVLDPVISVIVDEVKKTAAYWQNDHPNQPIEIVVLSGGSAGLPGLVSTATTLLGIEVTIADPFAGVTKEEQAAKTLAPYAPLYAVAVGLAMRV